VTTVTPPRRGRSPRAAGGADPVLAPEADDRSAVRQAFKTAARALRSFAPTLAVLEAAAGREVIDALIEESGPALLRAILQPRRGDEL